VFLFFEIHFHVRKPTICFVAARASESVAVQHVLTSLGKVNFGYIRLDRTLGVSFVEGELDVEGKRVDLILSFPEDQAGPATTNLFHVLFSKFRPALVIMTGICAGLRGKVKLGDLVVARKAFDASLGKIDNAGHHHTTTTFKPPPGLISFVDYIAQTFNWEKNPVPAGKPGPYWPEIHVETFASGPAVRADETTVEGIKKSSAFDDAVKIDRNTLAVEMEAAAFYQAAETLGVPSLVVKGVSDHADSLKDDTFHAFAKQAAAAFALEVVKALVRSDSL
jgi:nucleoside phosphorylase